MSGSKIETTKGLCAVAITKLLMKKYGYRQDDAYAKLLTLELYQLLTDDGTRLFLETNKYLCQCCEIEVEKGSDALYAFINET